MPRSKARILDEYLASAARAGDRRAFAQLADRWAPKLLSHAWRLTGDPELARDVAQDGWSDIVRGISRLNDSAAFPAWAFRIVTRRAADAIGKAQRRRGLATTLAAKGEARDVGLQEVESGAEAHLVRRAMNDLSPDHRAVLSLFYREDLSVAEIAAALSVPAGTVKTRLMHARRHLRAVFEGGSPDGRS